jgi:hypothetical protein
VQKSDFEKKLDTLLAKCNTPQEIAKFIDENFQYRDNYYDDIVDAQQNTSTIEHSTRQFDEKKGKWVTISKETEEVDNGWRGECATIPRILNDMKGDCSEGAALAAGLLMKLGYPVVGISGAAHIITAYYDRESGKWGTIGINEVDIKPPFYPTLEDVAIAHIVYYRKSVKINGKRPNDVRIVQYNDSLFSENALKVGTAITPFITLKSVNGREVNYTLHEEFPNP